MPTQEATMSSSYGIAIGLAAAVQSAQESASYDGYADGYMGFDPRPSHLLKQEYVYIYLQAYRWGRQKRLQALERTTMTVVFEKPSVTASSLSGGRFSICPETA